MPKSRNRKGQKKKSRQRTAMIKARKEKSRKELMEMLKKAQEEGNAQNVKSETDNIVEIDEDIGDFEL